MRVCQEGGKPKVGDWTLWPYLPPPLATRLPPACHRDQMTRGEWQLHANSGGRGSPWPRVAVALFEKNCPETSPETGGVVWGVGMEGHVTCGADM